jgi:hypothetical protein
MLDRSLQQETGVSIVCGDDEATIYPWGFRPWILPRAMNRDAMPLMRAEGSDE